MQKGLTKTSLNSCSIKVFLLFLLILLVETAFSQTSKVVEGYYLDLKKDTVRGFFNFDDLEQNRVAFYQSKTTNDYSTLRPNDVIEIKSVNKVTLISFNYGYEKSVFLSKLFSKDINLYKTYFKDEGEVFFISTLINPNIVRIDRNNPKAFFETYFEACKLDNNIVVNYSEKSLSSAVSTLNKCAHLEKKKEILSEQTKLRRRFSVSLGVVLGAFSAKPAIVEGTYAGTYDALAPTPSLGLLATLNMPYNLRLKIGLNTFSKRIGKSDTLITSIYTPQYGGANFYYKTPFEFTYSVTEIPIELGYYFKFISPKITPMVAVGLSALIPQKPTIVKAFSADYYKFEPKEPLPVSFYTVPKPPNSSTFIVNNWNMAYYVSAGVNLSLNTHSSLELSVRRVKDTDAFLGDNGETNVKTTRLVFALGYLYTFKR
jgi:hypothetical protein